MQAFDATRRPLPLRITAETGSQNGITRTCYTMHNDGTTPVRPALVRLSRECTGQKELHIFKPGMQKPSDTARFYTLKAGENPPYVNTWRGEWLASFGPREMLISSMSMMQSGTLWQGIGFGSFEAFHGLVVYRTDTPEIVVETWLETEEILLDPGESTPLESVIRWQKNDFNEAYQDYIGFLNTLYGSAPHPDHRGIAGWSDWEFYRNDKTSADIMASAGALAEANRDGLDIRTVVVDGGWAQNLAEWTETAASIPEGIAPLLHNIRAKGLHSGLWYAPYIVNTACRVVQEHPEFLLRDKEGNIVHATGSNVGPKCTMDFSVPGAMDLLRKHLEMFREWGVSYLKLDGPVLIHYDRGRFHDPRSTRFKQIRATLKLIREVCPDMIIESEGVYGPAIGIADCHRVTQDEHPFWTDPVLGISVVKINTLVMLLSAAWDRKCWSNVNMIALRDFATPKPYYLDKSAPDTPEGELLESLLTEHELQVFLTGIAFSGSTVFFSAPQERVARSPEMMKHLGRLLPIAHDLKLDVLDPEKDWPSLFRLNGENIMTSAFNWGEDFADLEVPVPPGTVLYDCFREKVFYPEEGRLVLNDMPPRSCRLFRHCTPGDGLTFAGASSHILGSGITFRDAPEEAVLELTLHDTADQSATLLVPEGFSPAIHASLAPARGGAEQVVPIAVDNRSPGILRLIFNAPVCGKLRITLKKG